MDNIESGGFIVVEKKTIPRNTPDEDLEEELAFE